MAKAEVITRFFSLDKEYNLFYLLPDAPFTTYAYDVCPYATTKC